MNEKISVIVPVFEAEKYLPRSIPTILRQSYKNLEIILVEDGSPDNSGMICDEFAKTDARIKVIHAPHGGLSSARNYGIESATGTYLTFMDADDELSVDGIEYLYHLIKKGSSYQMAIANLGVFYEQEEAEFDSSEEIKVYTKMEALEEMLYSEGYFVSACGKLYHRDLFTTIRYPYGKLFEDVNTTYRLLEQCSKIITSTKVIYAYMIQQNSLTTQNFKLKQLDLLETTRSMGEDLISRYPSLEKAVLRRNVYAHISTLCRMLNGYDRYPEEEEIVYQYIRQNRKKVLNDPKAPKRDRVALHCLAFGKQFFKTVWNFYQRMTGRK